MRYNHCADASGSVVEVLEMGPHLADVPVVIRFEGSTEDGREVTSAYTVSDRKKRYEIGSEEVICYDPHDPMFFCFAGREDELTRDYLRFLLIGGVIAAIVLIFAMSTI